MSESNKFNIGDDVRARGGIRGLVMDYREMTGGQRAVGIMNTNGLIEYHLEQAVESAEGMTGYPQVLDL